MRLFLLFIILGIQTQLQSCNWASLEIDLVSPTINNLTPPISNLYNTGDDLDFTVVFNKPVRITGSPRILIDIGGTTEYAVAVSSNLSSVHTFRRTVTALDLDTDGIDVLPGIDLNGGLIADSRGEASTLTFTIPSTAGVRVNFVAFNASVTSIAPLTDGSGKIYVAGTFTTFGGQTFNRIIRLNSNLTIDSSFNPGSGFNADVYTLALVQDGSNDVYAGGCFTSYNGTSRIGVARIQNNGSLHSGFDPGTGIDNSTACGTDKRVLDIQSTNDGSGDIYIVGKFDEYQGDPRRSFVRINDDGTADTLFDTVNKFPLFEAANDIEIARDGSEEVIITGGFSSFNGNPSLERIIRLDSTGTNVGSLGSLTSTAIHGLMISPNDDDDIYIIKQGGNYDATPNRLLRVNSNASVDAGFNLAGGSFDADPISIVQDIFGTANFFTGGVFTTYQAVDIPDGVAKFQDNGTRINAATFPGVALGSNGSVDVMVQDRVGKGLMYIGGAFTTFNGSSAGYFKVIDEKGFGSGNAPYIVDMDSTVPDNTSGSPITVAGMNIDIIVTYSEAVTVAGNPRLKLNTSRPGAARYATYFTGSGSNTITYRYITAALDSTAGKELSHIDQYSLFPNSGSVESMANPGRSASFWLPFPYDQNSLSFNRDIFIAVP